MRQATNGPSGTNQTGTLLSIVFDAAIQSNGGVYVARADANTADRTVSARPHHDQNDDKRLSVQGIAATASVYDQPKHTTVEDHRCVERKRRRHRTRLPTRRSAGRCATGQDAAVLDFDEMLGPGANDRQCLIRQGSVCHQFRKRNAVYQFVTENARRQFFE